MDEMLQSALSTGVLQMRYFLEDPDPVLSSNCSPFEPEEFADGTAARFSTLFIAKMLSQPTGIGLAANQVGILKRAFAMKYPDPGKQDSIVLFNPIVIPQGGDNDYWLYNEGCLSVPGVYNQVRRPKDVVVRYQNEEGDEKKLELTMLLARIALHENDHLNGLMFFDRMTKQMRKASLRDWAVERKRRRL